MIVVFSVFPALLSYYFDLPVHLTWSLASNRCHGYLGYVNQ